MKLGDVKTWRYQLQNIDPATIGRSNADLAVVDRAGNDGEFAPAAVKTMRTKPDGSQRIVLAYWSIGEAEDYRAYWRREWKKNPPPWLGPQNPDWPGNYGVRFWMPGWHDILMPDLRKIIGQGFDGVYLDKVDEFEDMGHRGDMIELVKLIAEESRKIKAGFLVVPQNGDVLLGDDSYRAVIDGLGREDLLFGEERDGKPNPTGDISDGSANLKLLLKDRKPVFAVEYTPVPPAPTLARLSALGYVGLIASRDLDR